MTEAGAGDGLAQVRRFIALTKRKEEIDKELKAVNAKIAALQEPLLAFFAESGMQRVTVDGRTAYVWTQVRGRVRSGVARDAAVGVLREHAPELVAENFNLNAVSSWLNEQRTLGEYITAEQFEAALPEDLRGVFEVYQVNRVQTVSA